MSDPIAENFDFTSAPPATSPSPGWMITFADLLSLLLSFFVLLFATTSINHQDWVRVMQPVTLYFGGKPAALPGAVAPAPVPPVATLDMNYLTATLRQLVAQDPGLAGATVHGDDHRAVLTLPAALLPCRRALDPGHRLAGLATLLGNVDNQVEIMGHAGLDPTASAGPEAWAGALDLADRVAGMMAAAGVSHPFERSGRADLPGGRSACAVDIVLHDSTVTKPGGRDGG